MSVSRALLSAVPVLALAISAGGCSAARGPAHPEPRAAQRCGATCADSVGITFLGVGGFLVRRGGEAVLTAPHFTMPGGYRVLLNLPAPTDTARVNRQVERLMPDSLRRQVRAILVGHAHYDHLMDVPHLVRRFFPDPRRTLVYGNDAMVATLWHDPWLRARLAGVEGGLGTDQRPGRWFSPAGSRIRFMSLASEHAPHLLRRARFIPERGAPVRSTPPERPWDWPQGQAVAYLVDFLDEDGRVAFRLHYQDAASTPPLGVPPALYGRDASRVDVAILCGASFDQVRGYPERLLSATAPRHAVVGHSDDFLLGILPSVPGTSIRHFNRRLDAALGPGRRWTPRVGETRWFCACAPGEEPQPTR